MGVLLYLLKVLIKIYYIHILFEVELIFKVTVNCYDRKCAVNLYKCLFYIMMFLTLI